MWLFAVTFIGVISSHGADECGPRCNDGGCTSTDNNGDEVCDCSVVSNGTQTGTECESFVDACTSRDITCLNNGKCIPMRGYWSCECVDGYFGVSCEQKIDPNQKALPKRPSVYHKTKIRPGEFTDVYLVYEGLSEFNYTLEFFNYGYFTNFLHDLSNTTMTVDEFYKICLELGSADFPLNTNTCTFAKTYYGNSNISVVKVNPYFMIKTYKNRTSYSFKGNKSMGGTYNLGINLYDAKEVDRYMNPALKTVAPFYVYEYHHFVIDDNLTYCLPFLDHGKYCSNPTTQNPLVVRRNLVFEVQMLVSNDEKMCAHYKSIEYTYRWRISLNSLVPVEYKIGPTEFERIFDKIDLNQKELYFPAFVLNKQYYTLQFIVTMKDSLMFNTNTCYLDVVLDALHAEIAGSSEPQTVSDSSLVTLDASASNNPNEPRQNQGLHINYVWTCDVEADDVNCKEHTTTDPIRKLTGFLNKSKKYVFKLITQVTDEYAKRVGTPDEGLANITFLPKSMFVLDITIICVKNCEALSNPSTVVYLWAETTCENNCSLEWYYKDNPNNTFQSANDVRELDTPSHIFITKKNFLDYNKVYSFKVQDSVSNGENTIIIRTSTQPIAGKCHVNPTSGIAGKTLFNITCSKFRDEYGDVASSYYFYERYDNVPNRSGLSLLMGWGSEDLNNIILPTSGKVNVIAISSYGTFVVTNISVQVFKSNTSDLVKMFKTMKIELKNGHTSATIRILSNICDVLIDNKITSGVSVLLKTLSKIETKGSIARIEQSISALTKVTHTCSVVNDHKITSADALAVSKNLVSVANNLFESLKTLRNKDIVVRRKRLERIYKCLKTIIDILIKDVYPVNYDPDSLVLVIQNIVQTLTVFGESILLHQFVFETPRIYESPESYFWSNMLNADMLRKHDNIFSPGLIEELLVDKEKSWGLKIFEIDKKLALWIKTRNFSNEVSSIIKFVALSSHDRPTNGKYLGLIHELVSPASITFNITEAGYMFDDYKEYRIVVPAIGSEQIEYDKAIQVFRIDMTEVGALFVTIRDASHNLLITWTKNRRPDSVLMTDEQYVTKIPKKDDFKISFQTHKDHSNDIHYIGIFADTAANSHLPSNRPNEIKFNMNMVCMRCLYWNNEAWSSEGLEIGRNSSVDGNIQCITYHFSLFKSSIFVMPELLNPIKEIHLFSTIANNMVCLILVMCIFIFYFILLYWASVNDKKDMFMGRVIILDDNYMGEDEMYLVTVYTGHGLGSGTSANVCIELNGTVSNSRAHWLHSSDYYRTMQRSNDDWFIIFTPASLGELQSIRIWHDNYGTDPDWYCQEIIVTEIRGNKVWVFEVERWFSLRESTSNTEHTINVSNSKNNWRKETRKNVEMGLRENHLWASVFIRHPRSPITRCQRLSVILCTILCIMLSSMMFYEKVHTNEENFQKFELKSREILVAIQSGILEFVLTFFVHKCFRQGRLVQLNTITHNTRLQESLTPNNNQQSTPRKAFGFIITHITENKLYYPVHTETIPEMRKWNNWFIIGWTCCAVVYIFTAFYIILYGLKFGRVKSLCWLTSITIAIIQGIVLSSPFKIILMSAAMATYKKTTDQFVTFRYNLTLHRYRNKTQTLLQDVEYVRAIRNYRRRRYLYEPLPEKTVEILREQRNRTANRNYAITEVVICAVLILTSLGCLYYLEVFSRQNDEHRANEMVTAYLKRVAVFNNRRITLDELKNYLSYKLLMALNSFEIYDDVPIVNDTFKTLQYDRRRWFGLYNSRLIGGGVRFRQKRVSKNGENDHGKYGVGWTEYDGARDNDTAIIPWTYSKPVYFTDFLYYESRMSKDEDAGYELHVTGMIDEQLIRKWLDAQTRRFYAVFQIYTPGADLVTMVEIRATTGCGINYAVVTDAVQTVPASSVFVEWDTYAFTVTASCLLLAAGAACLLKRAFRWTYRWTWWSAVHDGLLVALVVTTVVALFKRLSAMKQATDGLAAAATNGAYVDLWPACHMHAVCTLSITTLIAVALLKLLTTLWRGRGWPRYRTHQ